jgi:hypothetical protein
MDRRPAEVLEAQAAQAAQATEAAEATEGGPRGGGRRPPAPAAPTELEREQAYVAMLYGRLDRLRAHARAQLQKAQRQGGGGTHQARLDRDAFVSRHAKRLAQLEAVEHGLCFGRLDRRDGGRMYVGRLGLFDDDNEPLLVDWRAPAAQPFYRATAAAPGDVVRRRHLRTRGRAIVAIDDDVLNLDALSDAERGTLNGEAALLASLAPAGRAAWPTSWPPFRPSRTASSARACRASWSSRAARAPARRLYMKRILKSSSRSPFAQVRGTIRGPSLCLGSRARLAPPCPLGNGRGSRGRASSPRILAVSSSLESSAG